MGQEEISKEVDMNLMEEKWSCGKGGLEVGGSRDTNRLVVYESADGLSPLSGNCAHSGSFKVLFPDRAVMEI